MCTVDRSLGSFLDYKTHHIVDTHVAHHIFSYLPFYNAQVRLLFHATTKCSAVVMLSELGILCGTNCVVESVCFCLLS